MRVFTDEELAQMGRRTLDAIIEAIEAGDIEESKRLARRMSREFGAMHDLYCNWVTALISYIGRTFGEDKVADAERESCGVWLKPTLKAFEGTDFRGKVKMFVAGVRGHLCSLKIEEDDERVTFTMDPCPSGGRIIRGETGYTNFLRLSKPAPVTYGRTDVPAYCTHCATCDMLFIEWLGYPFFVTEPSSKLGGEPCHLYLYKDVTKIPGSVYERVGKKKLSP